ncbi:MAG TPA: hypothetical protein PKO06_21350, partial [Candidatus Ozemobacteraceae bacterium]|nr:hypothetical protein [Candidatus Ozemobacteraceae bacterium]
MRASEFESIDHVPPVDWKDAPQEVRDALNALKEGRDAPDVFFLKSDLTQTQKERRITIAWACTIFVAVFGLGVCAPLALKQSIQGGL